jgi:DNA-binding MarR family transcriptional regulator
MSQTDLAPTAHPSSGSSLATPPGADRPDPAHPVESSPVVAPVKKPRRKKPKAPKDSAIYKVAMATIALRSQGLRGQEIADQLGYTQNTIRTYLQRAHDKGWVNFDTLPDEESRIDVALKTKTLRNVNEFLDARDSDMTLEAAKGLGLFKQHQVVKGDVGPALNLTLGVKVELPPSAPANSLIQIRPGTVAGTPAVDIPVDAEIIHTAEDAE